MTYARDAARPARSVGVLALLPLLGIAALLSALRIGATIAALGPDADAPSVTSTSETWLYATIWVIAYACEAVAGWLLWHGRRRRYGSAALVVYWILLGLQALRLLNLLGNRYTAGQVPWSAFGTVVLLDVCAVIGMLVAWQVSRRAGALLGLVLCWLLYLTAVTGADALLRNGLPLA